MALADLMVVMNERPDRAGRAAARGVQRAGAPPSSPASSAATTCCRPTCWASAAARWRCAPTAPACAPPATARSALDGRRARWSSTRAPRCSSACAAHRPAASVQVAARRAARSTPPRWRPASGCAVSWPRDGGARAGCLSRSTTEEPSEGRTMSHDRYRTRRPQRRPVAGATLLQARHALPAAARPPAASRPVRARGRSDHAALRRHRRERVQGARRQVQGRYRHHHPVHDADLGRRGQARGHPAELASTCSTPSTGC